MQLCFDYFMPAYFINVFHSINTCIQFSHFWACFLTVFFLMHSLCFFIWVEYLARKPLYQLLTENLFYLISSYRRCLNLQWPWYSQSDNKTAALSFITCLHHVGIWINRNAITKVMLSAWLSKLSKLTIVGCTICDSYR